MRLSGRTLGNLGPGVSTPAYSRESLRPGILHLGLGAFHRAHQALYTEAALNRSGGDWGIVGVCMRSDAVERQLQAQGGLYSVLSEDGSQRRLQVVGALRRVLVAPRDVEELNQVFADPAIQIVTLTVTEKGYCLGPGGWSLDRDLPAVRRDLADPQQAATAIGVLARGLWHRFNCGGEPLTLISCDNLGENSARLRAALVDYLESTWPEMLPWLQRAVTFPCSMVDRIVPAMTTEGLHRQAGELGAEDAGAVATEPFSQWIIEDEFAAGRPDWTAVGVQLVAAIGPYEEIKLRLLNASHSAIAYLGLLAGRETVADVMADPALASFVRLLMSRDLMPALDVPADFDLGAYRDQLLVRFANPCLRHRCAQIAMDGTEKIPQRWLPTLRTQAGDSLLLRALAAWCYCVVATELPLDDPRLDK